MLLNTKTFCLNCRTPSTTAASEFALIDAVFGDLLILRFVTQTALHPFQPHFHSPAIIVIVSR